jgi:LysM repeat protein
VASTVLAKVLPVVIDRLTPQGQIPQEEDSLLDGALGGLLKKVGSEGCSLRPKGGSHRMANKEGKPDFSDVEAGGSSTAPTAEPVEQTYTVASGDSLSKIAKKFYGDANKWRRIFDANRDTIKNPDLIHPGQVLKIPSA